MNRGKREELEQDRGSARGALIFFVAIGSAAAFAWVIANQGMSPYAHEYDGPELKAEVGTPVYDDSGKVCGELGEDAEVMPTEVVTEGKSGDPIKYGGIAVDGVSIVDPHSCEGTISVEAADIAETSQH